MIFNLYRKERGGRACQSVQEYAEEFIRFLKEKEFYSNEESRENYLLLEMSAYYNMVKEEVFDQLEKEGISVEDENAVRKELKEVINSMNGIYEEIGTCKDFAKYTEKEFSKTSKKLLDSLMDACEDEHLPTDMRREWQHGIFVHLRSELFLNSIGTGVVFVGYGEKDIFPSAFPTVIGGGLGTTLTWNGQTRLRMTIQHGSCPLPKKM